MAYLWVPVKKSIHRPKLGVGLYDCEVGLYASIYGRTYHIVIPHNHYLFSPKPRYFITPKCPKSIFSYTILKNFIPAHVLFFPLTFSLCCLPGSGYIQNSSRVTKLPFHRSMIALNNCAVPYRNVLTTAFKPLYILALLGRNACKIHRCTHLELISRN
jgi:hypothetical protein